MGLTSEELIKFSFLKIKMATLDKTLLSQGSSNISAFLWGDVLTNKKEGILHCACSLQLSGHLKESFGIYFLLSYWFHIFKGETGPASGHKLRYRVRSWNQETKGRDSLTCNNATCVWGLHSFHSLCSFNNFSSWSLQHHVNMFYEL